MASENQLNIRILLNCRVDSMKDSKVLSSMVLLINFAGKFTISSILTWCQGKVKNPVIAEYNCRVDESL